MFDPKKLVIAVIIAYGVVVVAEKFRSESSRQLVRMRFWNVSRRFCQAQADSWSDLALRAGTAYQKARM